MSYKADEDHIAITSRETQTTRPTVFVPGCPVAPLIAVTQGESSDTLRRIASDSEIVSGKYASGQVGAQFAISYSATDRHRASAR